MGGPRGPQPGAGAPGLKQSQLPIDDPQSRTSIRSRGILKRQKALEEKTKESSAAVSSLCTEQEGFIEAEGLEKIYKIRQEDILKNVNEVARKKVFRLSLSSGPYTVSFSPEGNYLLFCGNKGTINLIDYRSFNSLVDINVRETVRDISFLHNHTLFAAAQKKYVYIYDHQGIEIHCLRDLMLTYRLEFLPYHFLMTSIGEFGDLSYYDISTGTLVARHKTKRGPCDVMAQNPTNAIISLGHNKGTVSLWTPNLAKPAVEMFCHKGKVTAIAAQDNYMITAGSDGVWRVWDIRRYNSIYKLNSYGGIINNININKKNNLFTLSFYSHIQIFNSFSSFYTKPSLFLTHELPGELCHSLSFNPYEDILCYGSNQGIGSLIIPSSGLHIYDNKEPNPMETKKQRQEREIRSLLDKIPAEMISLDNTPIGSYNKHRKAALTPEQQQQQQQQQQEAAAAGKKTKKQKNKQRGKNKIENKLKRTEKEKLLAKRQQTANRLLSSFINKKEEKKEEKETIKGALARFVQK